MRGLRLLAVAAALVLGGTAAAQDAPAEGQPEVAATPSEQMPTAAPAVPTAVPSEVGGLANVGTRPDATQGQPLGGLAIQPQVTALGQQASDFNTALLLIMAVVTLIVFGLLAWAAFRFSRRRNPVPSKTSHNTFVEVVWTLVPVLILVGIAIPSFKLLAAQYDPPKADVTIKATGHQWYWSYEYPDHGGFGFDAVMLSDEEASRVGEPRNLATDNRVVVPVGKTVKVLVTASDVLHAWAIPAFWVKMDAVPGKINETWFIAEKEGVYYGQCSELCGTKHGFMPIAVEVVAEDKFNRWVAARQADAGVTPTAAAPTTAAVVEDATAGGPASRQAGATPETPATSPLAAPGSSVPTATPAVSPTQTNQ
jgi:cytochrome c oxidase subunit II